MTGAAILPSGTDLQRAAIATPVVGMQRFNTTRGYEEIYTGATLGWQKLAYAPAPPSVPANVTLSGVTTLDPVYVCNDFTVSAGATLTGSTGCIVRATGNVVINASTWTLTGIPGQPPIPAVLASNYAGQNGAGYGAGQLVTAGVKYSPYAQIGGSSGGVGSANSGGTGTCGSGSAGGYLVIIAQGDITFNGTVVVDCAGGNAVTGGNSSGGGGGGSGGTIILQTPLTITTPATVTFNASGGNGCTGGGGFNGGGGGSGGWVILQSGNLVDSSTKTLTGGIAGGGTTGPVGGGGGGNAGNGGAGAAGSAAGNGSAGIFLTYGSPY